LVACGDAIGGPLAHPTKAIIAAIASSIRNRERARRKKRLTSNE
jgi:hypothetical protein